MVVPKSMIKLNLGCGAQVVDGWINVDYSLGAKFSKLPFFSFLNNRIKFFNLTWDKRIYIHDLTCELPWANEEVDVIYTSHTLEHLNKQDGYNLLSEIFRILRNGGVLRVNVPDLEIVVDGYKNEKILAEDFLEQLGVKISKPRGLRGIIKKLSEYPHQCMYNADRLKAILEHVGSVVHEMAYAESKIDDIEEIELKSRTKDAVVLEAVKVV